MPLLQQDDDQTTAPPATTSLGNTTRALVLAGDTTRVRTLGLESRVTVLERAGRALPLFETGVQG